MISKPSFFLLLLSHLTHQKTAESELSKWATEAEKTKAEEELLKKHFDESNQKLDQERRDHGETKRKLQHLEVSGKGYIIYTTQLLVPDSLSIKLWWFSPLKQPNLVCSTFFPTV